MVTFTSRGGEQVCFHLPGLGWGTALVRMSDYSLDGGSETLWCVEERRRRVRWQPGASLRPSTSPCADKSSLQFLSESRRPTCLTLWVGDGAGTEWREQERPVIALRRPFCNDSPHWLPATSHIHPIAETGRWFQIKLSSFLWLDFLQVQLSFQGRHPTSCRPNANRLNKRAAFFFCCFFLRRLLGVDPPVASDRCVRKSAPGLTCIISLVDAIAFFHIAPK